MSCTLQNMTTIEWMRGGEMTKSTGKKQVGSLVGVRFTYLLVLAKDDVRSTKSGNYYECLCDCGIVKSVLAAKLNNGNTRS